jgi:hypothetical protein
MAGVVDGLAVGGWNQADLHVRGAQLAMLANHAGSLDGVGIALTNWVDDSVKGAQIGVVNIAAEVTGVQLGGIHNQSENVVGAQIGGLVNHADKLHGLQIGFLNFNRSGPLPFFPIFNFGFSDESEED